MTTEDIVESFLSAGVKAYRKMYGNTLTGRKLSRHETVTIGGVEFSCWKELTAYKMAEYIKEIVPTSYVELTLAGNETILEVELTDEEQLKLNGSLFSFLNKMKLV